jgi:hypothetical protein
MSFRVETADASFAARRAFIRFGTAMEANKTIIASTSKSSISEKPGDGVLLSHGPTRTEESEWGCVLSHFMPIL